MISYHVISADGHPVAGSYPITIGNPPQEEALDFPLLGGSRAWSRSVDNESILQYASRGLWYLMLLALTGWVIWLRLLGAGGTEARKSFSVLDAQSAACPFGSLIAAYFYAHRGSTWWRWGRRDMEAL